MEINDMKFNTGLTIKCTNCETLVSQLPDGSFPFHECPLPKGWLEWAENITSLDDPNPFHTYPLHDRNGHEDDEEL